VIVPHLILHTLAIIPMGVTDQIVDNPEEVFHDLPDINTYRENLNKLRHTDLSTATADQIHEAFFKHALFSPTYISVFNQDEFTMPIYRVRLNVDAGKENVYLNSTFSYPNGYFCRNNGRANIKGRSVFYCSDYAVAALLESKPKNGDSGCLSIWKVKADREVKAAVFLPERLRKTNNWYEHAEALHKFLKSQSPLFTEMKEEQVNLLNEFVCNQFIYEKEPYPITSWLSDRILYNTSPTDLIIYPSVITNSHFCNMAVHPNFVDAHLRLERLIQFKVDSIKDSKLNYTLGLVGEATNTNILWRQPDEKDLQQFAGIINEGIARAE
jgi:hypothetical protein